MNYFAHLHLAHLSNTSLTGNLLGDFVKGSKLSYLPFELELGIRLHRKIDSYTDTHPICLSFKAEHTSIRRFAGIGLDILFDHLIAKQLGSDYKKMCNHFYQILLDEKKRYKLDLTEVYKTRLSIIIKEDWLTHYQYKLGIENALIKISQRLKKPVELDQLVKWYYSNQQRVDKQFNQLYLDTKTYTKRVKSELVTKIHLM